MNVGGREGSSQAVFRSAMGAEGLHLEPLERFRVETASATHIGRRSTNADAVLSDAAAGLYAVADGMGDQPRSSRVARMALETVRAFFVGTWTTLRSSERSVEEAADRLVLGIEQAHFRIHAPWMPRVARLGTTFAGVVVCGDHLCVGQVGDSRIYLIRGSKGGLAQIGEDHTVAQEARHGGMAAERAADLPDAHKLTQILGFRRRVVIEPLLRRWEPGDAVLLCTDGLSDCLQSEAIASIVLDVANVDTAVQTLVDQAVERGATDNASAVLLRRMS